MVATLGLEGKDDKCNVSVCIVPSHSDNIYSISVSISVNISVSISVKISVKISVNVISVYIDVYYYDITNRLDHVLLLFTGSEWHLRKANWMGELGEIVDDEVQYIHTNNIHVPYHRVLQ